MLIDIACKLLAIIGTSGIAALLIWWFIKTMRKGEQVELYTMDQLVKVAEVALIIGAVVGSFLFMILSWILD